MDAVMHSQSASIIVFVSQLYYLECSSINKICLFEIDKRLCAILLFDSIHTPSFVVFSLEHFAT